MYNFLLYSSIKMKDQEIVALGYNQWNPHNWSLLSYGRECSSLEVPEANISPMEMCRIFVIEWKAELVIVERFKKIILRSK